MKLKYKLVLLFMFMICVLSIVTGTYSIVQMKNKIIEAAQSKLLSDLALSRTLLESRYPGDWSLKDGQLYKGDFPFNYDYTLVDEIGNLTGDTVTIFQKNMRISTNVIQQDGARAIDTPVSDTVSNAVLSNGETYVGKANVVGTWNQTVYEPIRDSSENIIGIWYVGVPNTLYDQIARDFQNRLILFTIIGVGISVFMIWVFSDKITKPLAALEKATHTMAEGDLTNTIQISSHDEIGSQATAFHKMQENMNDALKRISLASTEVSLGSKQVSDSSTSLAQGSTEQASQVQELTALMENISVQMKLTAEHAKKADRLSSEAIQCALTGSSQMKEMQEAINAINIASNEISNIIKVIDEIAFQTNVLSLNASVEAARAGQQGKGFAVVAEEVRNLASRSAQAVGETSALIKNSIQKVEFGTKIASSTATSLEEIVHEINQMADALDHQVRRFKLS